MHLALRKRYDAEHANHGFFRGSTLEVHFDRFGKVHVASVHDTPRLDQSNHEEFGKALLDFFEQHPGTHLLVSLAGVEFISSAALSELIQAMRTTARDGGTVRVCATNEYVLSVFEVTRLDKTFRLGGHVREAAEQFNTDLEAAAT